MRFATFHLLLTGILCGIVLAGCGNGTQRPRPNKVSEAANKPEAKSGGNKAETPKPAKTNGSTPKGPGSTNGNTGGDDASSGRQTSSQLALPTGDKKTSFLLVETSAPEKNQRDRPYQYEIRLRNISTSVALADVSVTQRVHKDMTIRDSKLTVVDGNQKTPQGRTHQTTAAPVGSGDSARVIWTFNLLEPGETATIQVQAVGATKGDLVSYVGIDYRPLLRFKTEITQPELKLVKRGPKDGVVDNRTTFTYTYQLSNVGNQAVKNLTLTDELPKGLKTEKGEATVVRKLAELPGEASQEWNVRVVAEDPGDSQQYESQAVVTGGDDNMSIESNLLTTTVRRGRLEVEAKPDPDEQYIGQKVRYTVRVKNVGKATVTPRLTATLGKGALLRGLDPSPEQANQWALPPLAAGETSKPIKLLITSNSPGELKSTFAAAFDYEGELPKAKPTTVATTFKPLALHVAVISSEARVREGQSFTCSVQLSNDGAAPDSDLELSLQLPECVRLESVSGDSEGTYDPKSRRVKLQTIKELQPGGKRTWRVRVKAEQPGGGNFVARLTSSALGRSTVLFESDEVTVTEAPREPLAAPPRSRN